MEDNILVDLSDVYDRVLPQEEDSADKENAVPVTDSIEISRSDQSRRSSLTLLSPLKPECRILKDITDQTVGIQVDHTKDLDSSAEQQLLDEEMFDFDFNLSPETRNLDSKIDDESEVFFGPVRFSERCRAVAVSMEPKIDKAFSPLNPSQLAELVKEANTVAFLLQAHPSTGSDDSHSSCPKTGSSSSSNTDSPFKSQSREKSINENNLSSQLETDEKCPAVGKTDEEHRDNSNSTRTIARPSLVPKNRSLTNLNKTFSNESLDSGFSKKSNFSSGDSDDAYETCSVQSDNSDVSLSKIPLSRPKSGVSGAAFSKMPKMQPPSQKSRSNLERSFVKPQSNTSKCDMNRSLNVSALSQFTSNVNKKSGIKTKLTYLGYKKASSGVKTISQETKLNQPKIKAPVEGPPKGLKAPATKLQLLQPSQLQRRILAPNKQCNITGVAGPVKATNPHMAKPTLDQNKTATGKELKYVTPVKPDKKVQPKRLLTNSLVTPKKEKKDSTSSVESLQSSTPASTTKRRSFLPTPTKTRMAPIPSCARSSTCSSVSSFKSMSDCDTDQSAMDEHSTFSHSKVLSSTFDEIDDKSPSGMLAKNPKVVNTPNLPVRKPSKWSPVRRTKARTIEEQAFLCTKRTLSK